MEDVENTGYLADGFRNVDKQSDFTKFKTCLTFIDSLPSFQSYKSEADRRLFLSQGGRFLDVGCGLGFDTERIGAKLGKLGEVVGLDNSRQLLLEAQARLREEPGNVSYVLEDAHDMSFGTNWFDGARTDRVLQHIENPRRVIEEMARVVRPGGRVVCAEPDWGSFMIDDEDLEAVGTVSAAWTSRLRNKYIGRQLGRLMKAAGLDNIAISGELLVTSGIAAGNIVFDIEKTCHEAGIKKRTKRYIDWYRKIEERDKDIPVLSGVTIIVASGTKLEAPC
jgi:ubiquinone/menaquinone biosynthesis C-methylase UbiE